MTISDSEDENSNFSEAMKFVVSENKGATESPDVLNTSQSRISSRPFNLNSETDSESDYIVKAATLAELSLTQKSVRISFDADISTDSEIDNIDPDNIVGNAVPTEFSRVKNGLNQTEEVRVSLCSAAIFPRQFSETCNNSSCRFGQSAMQTNPMRCCNTSDEPILNISCTVVQSVAHKNVHECGTDVTLVDTSDTRGGILNSGPLSLKRNKSIDSDRSNSPVFTKTVRRSSVTVASSSDDEKSSVAGDSRQRIKRRKRVTPPVHAVNLSHRDASRSSMLDTDLDATMSESEDVAMHQQNSQTMPCLSLVVELHTAGIFSASIQDIPTLDVSSARSEHQTKVQTESSAAPQRTEGILTPGVTSEDEDMELSPVDIRGHVSCSQSADIYKAENKSNRDFLLQNRLGLEGLVVFPIQLREISDEVLVLIDRYSFVVQPCNVILRNTKCCGLPEGARMISFGRYQLSNPSQPLRDSILQDAEYPRDGNDDDVTEDLVSSYAGSRDDESTKAPPKLVALLNKDSSKVSELVVPSHEDSSKVSELVVPTDEDSSKVPEPVVPSDEDSSNVPDPVVLSDEDIFDDAVSVDDDILTQYMEREESRLYGDLRSVRVEVGNVQSSSEEVEECGLGLNKSRTDDGESKSNDAIYSENMEPTEAPSRPDMDATVYYSVPEDCITVDDDDDDDDIFANLTQVVCKQEPSCRENKYLDDILNAMTGEPNENDILNDGFVNHGGERSSDESEVNEATEMLVPSLPSTSKEILKDCESLGVVVDEMQNESDRSDDVPPLKKLKIQLEPLRNSLVLSETYVDDRLSNQVSTLSCRKVSTEEVGVSAMQYTSSKNLGSVLDGQPPKVCTFLEMDRCAEEDRANIVHYSAKKGGFGSGIRQRKISNLTTNSRYLENDLTPVLSSLLKTELLPGKELRNSKAPKQNTSVKKELYIKSKKGSNMQHVSPSEEKFTDDRANLGLMHNEISTQFNSLEQRILININENKDDKCKKELERKSSPASQRNNIDNSRVNKECKDSNLPTSHEDKRDNSNRNKESEHKSPESRVPYQDTKSSSRLINELERKGSNSPTPQQNKRDCSRVNYELNDNSKRSGSPAPYINKRSDDTGVNSELKYKGFNSETKSLNVGDSSRVNNDLECKRSGNSQVKESVHKRSDTSQGIESDPKKSETSRGNEPEHESKRSDSSRVNEQKRESRRSDSSRVNEPEPKRSESSRVNESKPRRSDSSRVNELEPKRSESSWANQSKPRWFESSRVNESERKSSVSSRVKESEHKKSNSPTSFRHDKRDSSKVDCIVTVSSSHTGSTKTAQSVVKSSSSSTTRDKHDNISKRTHPDTTNSTHESKTSVQEKQKNISAKMVVPDKRVIPPEIMPKGHPKVDAATNRQSCNASDVSAQTVLNADSERSTKINSWLCKENTMVPPAADFWPPTARPLKLVPGDEQVSKKPVLNSGKRKRRAGKELYVVFDGLEMSQMSAGIHTAMKNMSARQLAVSKG